MRPLDAQEDEVGAGRAEGRVAEQHLEEHHAQRPQVHLHAAHLVVHRGGRHVLRGPHELGPVEVWLHQVLRSAEIAELQVACCRSRETQHITATQPAVMVPSAVIIMFSGLTSLCTMPCLQTRQRNGKISRYAQPARQVKDTCACARWRSAPPQRRTAPATSGSRSAREWRRGSPAAA